MRFFYLDAALQARHSHHGEYCRLIAGELRRRGLRPVIWGHRELRADLAEELGAQPCFRWFTYLQSFRRKDPIAGWLRDFDVGWRLTLEDMQRITPFSNEDIVYFSSVWPAQFMALLQWLGPISPERRPRVFVEFGTEPGVKLTQSPARHSQIEVLEPRLDPRGTLYRYVGSLAKPQDFPRACLFTFEQTVSEIYRVLTGWPFATLPWPHGSVVSNRSRSGKRPVRAAVIGHQRSEKGFQHIPEVMRQLFDKADVEFLVHNSAPEEMVDTQNALRELARNHPRLTLDERSVYGLHWAGILEQADLMICPYDPVRYATSHSALVTECIANGIPCVVPANTIAAAMCREFGGVAVEISEWTATAIVASIRTALANFDMLAERARAAAQRWQQLNGAPRLVDRLLQAP
ncbi:MAG TPA: hypothetical protein VGP68_11140 [Gemmataceae bacterium]|nr:hypothetical protein [Gemmataceae bacterium]